MKINRRVPVTHPAIRALLDVHLRELRAISPPESAHALDLEGLQSPQVGFLSAWEGEALMGFGALKQLDARHAEIKSMRTAPAYLRKGVASALLEALIDLASENGLSRISLETGTPASYVPARTLYKRYGFTECSAFADYPRDDPFSTFMTLELNPPSP